MVVSLATTKETQPTKLTAAQLKKKVETQEEKIKSLKEGAWCYMCDTHKAKDKFYVSTDPMSKSGLTPICKDCAKKIALRTTNGVDQEPTRESVQLALRYLGKPFLEKVWDSSIQEVENLASGKVKSNVCAYYTEGQGMFILPLDPSYMRIAGVFPDGSFACAMDMSYFKRNSELLEYWGEPFNSMWNTYQNTNEKYQLIPEEYNVCIKFRSEDWETIVPVLTPIFLSLIDLMDASDYQAVQQAANIYKLVWLEMKTMGNDVDDWAVNPDIMIQYFNRMLEEALPPYMVSRLVEIFVSS